MQSNHDLDARQHEQLQKWQAKQQAGKNHKNDAHDLEMKALPNGCNQEHSGQKNRNAHVLVSGFPRLCTLISHVRGLLIQAKKLLVLRVVIFEHEYRTGRRLRIVERVRPQPGCEGRSVFVAKAPLEELRRLLFATELGGEPTVERIAVVDPLLSCQG